MATMMRNAESPAAFVAALSGWQLTLVRSLRKAVRASPGLEERVKWGNLVYFSNGPVCVIHVESGRVVFSFWRGRRLRELEPRLKPGGKYEMAGLQFGPETRIAPKRVGELVREAVALNAALGDPTSAEKERG